jgi:hypothetical protein
MNLYDLTYIKKLMLLYKWQLILGLIKLKKGFEFEFELKPRYTVDYNVDVL